MTDDINRMLAAACEREERPVHAPVDDVVRRGRRRVRLRRSGGAAFSMLAVGGVLAAIVAWPSGGSPTSDRGVEPAVTADSQPGPAGVGDDEVIQGCLQQDRQFVTHSENKAGGGTDPITGWSVAVTQAQGTWIRAILVSPDERRFAYCMSDERGPGWGDYYREAVDLRSPYDVWLGANGSEGPVPDAVARLTFETPDGEVTDATIADGFYLWYADRTIWGPEPVWATFYDADGNVLERVNANPAPDDPPCTWQTDGDQLACVAGDGSAEDRMLVHDDRLNCDWEVASPKQLESPIAGSSGMLFCRDDSGDVVGMLVKSPNGERFDVVEGQVRRR